jgi:hypothetical protein
MQPEPTLRVPLKGANSHFVATLLPPEAGTITFILISDHILDHCAKMDLRSYQDHIADQIIYFYIISKTGLFPLAGNFKEQNLQIFGNNYAIFD